MGIVLRDEDWPVQRRRWRRPSRAQRAEHRITERLAAGQLSRQVAELTAQLADAERQLAEQRERAARACDHAKRAQEEAAAAREYIEVLKYQHFSAEAETYSWALAEIDAARALPAGPSSAPAMPELTADGSHWAFSDELVPVDDLDALSLAAGELPAGTNGTRRGS